MRISILCLFLFSLFIFACSEEDSQETSGNQDHENQVELIFGFPKDSFIVVQDEIKPNEVLSNILLKHHISWPEIEEVVNACEGKLDFKRIKSGKNYTVLCNRDSLEKAAYFIYEQNPIDYVVIDLVEHSAYTGAKEIDIQTDLAQGTINSSLFLTMQEQSLSPALAMEMADIYAWTIDFYRLAKGDNFKVYYEKKFVEEEFVGIGRILACEFVHKDKNLKTYRFEKDDEVNYYDENGRNMRKAFLKSPLKFGRISSRYSNRRFHPVQKRWKAHRGTDYAAPTGTPIRATGDGQVIAATYKKHNGKYVKIRHNSTYTTQYLHMSKIAVTNGQQVKQGEIIGYVGSTGLATGPHVCYRFWKNGQEINHLNEVFPDADPLEQALKAEFNLVKDSLTKIMNRTNNVLVYNIDAETIPSPTASW